MSTASLSLFKSIMAANWPGVVAWQTEKAEESIHLEFKVKDRESPSMTDKDWGAIAQAMSAFANAEGGVLVFGVHAKSRGKNLPDQVQSIVPLTDVLSTKGAVQRRLPNLITPPLPGARVEHIDERDSAGAVTGAGIVVIYVPASGAGAHRAMEGEAGVRHHYHMRSDVSSIIMHHSLLAERFGRRPLARLYLAVQYSLSRYLCSVEVRIGNLGRGYAERPAVSFVQYPDPENPDCGGDVLWHLMKPAKGWDIIVRPAGGKEGTGAVIRANAETVLYPGMELPLGFCEAEQRHAGRRSLHLAVHGTLYALNASAARFRLVQDFAIDEADLARTVGRIDVPVIETDEDL